MGGGWSGGWGGGWGGVRMMESGVRVVVWSIKLML